jgi:hypothetical protein
MRLQWEESIPLQLQSTNVTEYKCFQSPNPQTQQSTAPFSLIYAQKAKTDPSESVQSLVTLPTKSFRKWHASINYFIQATAVKRGTQKQTYE